MDAFPHQGKTSVDFSYAFAPPHRIAIGLPDRSDRTLLDAEPGSLRVAWTYGDLTGFPPGAFMTPTTAWDIRLHPLLDGRPFAANRWSRLDDFLPALEDRFEDGGCSLRLEAVGAETAALIRIRIANESEVSHRFSIRLESRAWGENPAWIDPDRGSGDHLLAGWNERADRLLLLTLGAESHSEREDGSAPGPKSLAMVWDTDAGETREGWIVRPYRAYAADVPDLRASDWTSEFEAAKAEWRTLLGRAIRVSIPDPGVEAAYYAGLADCFIMREPIRGGAIGAVPGTETYRAANVHEAAVVSVALDQAGLHEEAASGYDWCLESQEPDGNWNEPKGWGHTMWSCAGFKAWAAMERFRLTNDREFLASLLPRLIASSRWQERERSRTRVMEGSERSPNYGLMPRGFGDCGLMDDDDLYGVFFPHNLWAVYADRLAVEAAEILGRDDALPELRRIYETGRDDLLAALERGAIREKEYRWLPGVSGKTSGSRWGALNALAPCGLLPPGHELIEGTFRRIESRMSEGGIPMHTGWMEDGMWVAITLDNLAEAHLARGNGDAAAGYLYASLNHGTPLLSWCEERGPEPGTTRLAGDLQHLWTPVAVARCIRDCMVREDGDGLRLASGTAREWLASGSPVGIADAPTHFGRVSYRMRYDAAASEVVGVAEFPEDFRAEWVALHLRLPEGRAVVSISAESGASPLPNGEEIRWERPRGIRRFAARIGEREAD